MQIKKAVLILLSLGMMFSAGIVYAEQQPHMMKALQALEQAKNQLQKAGPGKGGHSMKATALIDQAIAEVKEGIRYDNKH